MMIYNNKKMKEGEQKVLLDTFENDLVEACLQCATQREYLNGQLFETDDLNELWDEVAPEYMADAVPNVPSYPLVAIGWAAYLGMAYAHFWDKDWEHFNEEPNPYQYVSQVRGFDLMDEYVCNEIIGVGYESVEGQRLEDVLRAISEICLTRIKKEEVEPQSQLAFHVFARATKTMYRIGAAMELHRLGYKYEKIG